MRTALSVPFVIADEYAGTIWVMRHQDDTSFDSVDVDVLQTLGAFASTVVVNSRAREALEQAEASRHTLEALLAYIPEGITIAKGKDVMITHVSRYGLDLTRRPDSELLGVTAPLHAQRWQVYFPNGRPVPENELPLTRASRQGEIVRNEELVLRRPDGTATTVLCNAGPIRGKDGSIRGGLAAWRDVDELRHARAALQSSEEMFRTLAESLPANLFIAGLDGLVTYANRYLYETTGASQGTLFGSGWADYVHPDDRCLVQSAWRDAVDSTGEFKVEKYRSRVADGSYRWYATRGQRFNGPDGRPLGWCGMSIDIDDAHCAQDALRAAIATKDDFLATLAHELRNPLAPIRTAAQVLGSQRIDAEAAGKCTAVIARQVAIMARLLDDLLDMSRITRGKLELQREPVLLSALLGQAIETSRPLIDALGHELVVRLPEHPVHMALDSVRLIQVISNLLNNAAKFTPSGGRIELSAAIDDEGMFVKVADNGVGLVPGSEERIFGMFAQAGAAPRGETGLGIGLALARALVQLHGGRIEARSDGLGHGSEFCLRLPLTTGEAVLVPQAPPSVARRMCRVLLVDDNADILESLAMFLGLEGHEVRVAQSGSKALTVARDFSPEVVLLDIGMPEMDGYELARRLRQERGLELTRLIAISGWGSLADKEKASTAGFDLHFTKPVDPDQLLQALSSFH